MIASLAKVKQSPEVYATHDVTGHHHPAGAELEELREHGNHPATDEPEDPGHESTGTP